MNKMDKIIVLGTTAFLFVLFAVTVSLSLLLQNIADIRIIYSDNLLGMIEAPTLPVTAWHTAAGVISLEVLVSFIVGLTLTSYTRTLLGAGMTRKHIFARLSILGLVTTGLYTVLAAVMWGLSALGTMPEISGVNAISLIIIPCLFLMTYMLGIFVTALFVRFTWWHVLLGGLILQFSLGFVSYRIQRTGIMDNIPEPQFGQAAAIPLTLGIALAAWALTWPLLRNLPMRRS